MNPLDLLNKKVGVWGFGIVGRSVAKYLLENNIDFQILDNKIIQSSELCDFSNNVNLLQQERDLDKFLIQNDFIVPSPGVDLRSFSNFNDKFISELDLFFSNFKKPIIAITGTLGKTTITHLICEILKSKNIKAIAAGNIGIGMCDLILRQHEIDIAVIEVSSFQLEHCKKFAPNFSIWTNFYTNHLDRHLNEQEYFDAKFKILEKQSQSDYTLLPFGLITKLLGKNIKSSLNFFSLYKPENEQLKKLRKEDKLFFVEDGYLLKLKSDQITFVVNFSDLPKITFNENWLVILAALHLQKVDLKNINFENLILPEHRLEKFVCFNQIDFYNDSKATLPDATLAAINKLNFRPIILFLGGLSKGIDRSQFINNLKNKVKKIICFGAEREQLKLWCEQNNIEAYASLDLQSAIDICFKLMMPGDHVLFSPSGSSFDLFANYEQRGKVFRQLVVEKIKKEESSGAKSKEENSN